MSHETCMCQRCVPTSIVGTVCSKCGQEVRMGERPANTGRRWLHREEVDHIALLGHLYTFAEQEETRRQREDVIRYNEDGKPYTTAEYEISKDKDAARRKRRLAELRGEPEEEVSLPPMEVVAHDVDPAEFAPRSGIRQVINLIGKQGWELVSVRHWRGPYTGADGSLLSISDTHRVKARCAGLDGSLRVAVASWRDGKFDFAYVGTARDGRLNPTKVDATTMKNFVKGQDEPDASAGDDQPGQRIPGLDPGLPGVPDQPA